MAPLREMRLAAEAKGAGEKKKQASRSGQDEAMTRHRRRTSLVKKRTITIGPRLTSMALEDAFWSALKNIAASENTSLNQPAPRIDADRQHTNFSSAIRLYVLNHYRRGGGGTGGRAKREKRH